MVAGRDLRTRAGFGETLLSRDAHLGGHAAGKKQVDGLQMLVGRNDLRAELFLGQLGQFERAALHREIQIANREAAERVAHGAAGQEYAGAGFGGELPHLPDHAVLVGAQVALQHEHVIAHSLLPSIPLPGPFTPGDDVARLPHATAAARRACKPAWWKCRRGPA